MSDGTEAPKSGRIAPDPGSLQGQLLGMWRLLHEQIRNRWQRSLPFADTIVDRWERASMLGFGDGSSIYDSALVIGEVNVGKHVWIGPSVVLDGSGGLTIGDYCSISAGVQIYTHDTVQWALSGGLRGPQHSPTKIGSRCYIGPQTVISRGVHVGDGCVVGAHSLVNRDIPDGMKAYGIPCRVIGPAVSGDES